MADYTTTLPNNILPPKAIEQGAPELLYRKWQAYDRFWDENGKKAFDTKESRQSFYKDVIRAIDRAFQSPECQIWLKDYDWLLTGNLSAIRKTCFTQWRLLIGYATNPTLESGLTLHHIYGFPCIPGSAVKGLLHHVAEMQIMEDYVNELKGWETDKITPDRFQADPPDWLFDILNELSFIRKIFGSIHLEQATHPDDQIQKVGPLSPKSFFEDLFYKMEEAEMNNENWSIAYRRFSELTKNHTGGMLCCYDAIPDPQNSDLLQTDILNPHYPKYYEEKEYEAADGIKLPYPPSDDQSPIPVTFLAVAPEKKFHFYYRIVRNNISNRQIEKDIIRPKVDDWLKKALSEWGIGAKTAAGYGYFNTGLEFDISTADHSNSESLLKSTPPPPAIEPVEPQSFTSKIKPGSKLRGISKNYKIEVWRQIAENEYIAKITGIKANLVELNMNLPARDISAEGKSLLVFYQQDRFYCQVELKLQGIESEGEAQWVWENQILTNLPG